MLHTKSLALVFFLFSLNCYAFKFTPMSQSIDLSQKKTRAVFTIENDSASPMAIELKLKSRKMNKDGSEDQLDLSSDGPLTLYPEQLIIPSGQKRSVRVTWSADKRPVHEQAYRVIAEQLPVNLNGKEKKPGIQMLLRYVAALYVNPGEQKSKVLLENYSISQKTITLDLHNKGGEHQVLNNMLIIHKKGEDTHEIKASDIEGLQGENILAKTLRSFNIENKGPLSSLSEDSDIEIGWID